MMNPKGITLLFCLIHVSILGGCTARTWNAPLLPESAITTPYNFKTRLPHNSPDLFVVLSFSGGGTRSAAFAYGVLEKFRDTQIRVNGTQKRLLDEIDVITSVSGGSYTAAYYGLFGDRVFEDFHTRFLGRDVQKQLSRLMVNPVNLASITRQNYNRADLIARWLDLHLFDQKRFSDLSQGALPFVIINASDLNNGVTFSFIQQQFDFLCSDLSNYPVANAVTASSAVPVVFGTISLKNYKSCPQREESWVTSALKSDDALSRRFSVARALDRYSRPERMPIVRLVDGGVTDNLGVRGSMMSPVAHYGNVPDMAGAFDAQQLKKVQEVLVVVVNAQKYAEYDWSADARDPGIISTVAASFDSSLGLLNSETITLARQGFEMWENRVNQNRDASTKKVNVHFTTLTFSQIEDAKEREWFNKLPTSLSLEAEQVDRVKGLAGKLLDKSPAFQRFLRKVE